MSENENTVETLVINKQNGIKRPEPGSRTGALWDIADRQSNALNAPAPRKAVIDEYLATVGGANISTANTQYARWVKYHGMADTLAQMRSEAAAARKAEVEEAKAAKAAAAEAAREEKRQAAEAAKAEKQAAREAKAAEREAEKQRKAAANAGAEAA